MYYWWGDPDPNGLQAKNMIYPFEPYTMAGMDLHIPNDPGSINHHHHHAVVFQYALSFIDVLASKIECPSTDLFLIELHVMIE